MRGRLRIVAGDLGGRRIASPGGRVRPTTERVREAIFSSLGDLSGLAVADLYCGSGALGIEAISRGAKSAVLVDVDTRVAAKNVDALGLSDRVSVERRDAADFLDACAAKSFDLVFADPPYTLAPRLVEALDPSAVMRVMTPAARLVVESRAGAPVLPLPVSFDREYSGTSVRIYEVGD